MISSQAGVTPAQSRSLNQLSLRACCRYFSAKVTPLAELNAARPPDKARVDAWLEEWADAAEAAGITEDATCVNTMRGEVNLLVKDCSCLNC